MPDSEQYLTHIVRKESGRLISVLMNHSGDIQLVEDCLQDAFVQAMKLWPEQGRPQNPQGWLLTIARRRLIDRFRRDSHRNHEQTIQHIIDSLETNDELSEADQSIPDERLKLIFTCCHPALAKQAQIALTLKTLCGLSVREIARAYLVSETTMNQRLTRAKQKIKKAGIAYKIPDPENLEQRLPSVLAVIYLIFNESYTAYEGQTLTRQDLADEAIRLARVLFHLMPRPDVAGLLSLMLFHNSRRVARHTHDCKFISLEKQNRQLWDADNIKEAHSLLINALSKGQPDAYQIQAAISALHADAKSWADTDWSQIISLYEELYKLNPSPIVKLNQIVAIANSGQPVQAFIQLKSIENLLKDYQPFYAAKADMARQLLKFDIAKNSYERAIKLTKNNIERDYLLEQLKTVPN